MAQLPGQSSHGGRAVEPAAPLLSHRPHQRPLVARPARLRRKAWTSLPSAAESMCGSFSIPTATPRELQERSVGQTVCWPPNCCLLYTSDAADEEDSVDLGG